MHNSIDLRLLKFEPLVIHQRVFTKHLKWLEVIIPSAFAYVL